MPLSLPKLVSKIEAQYKICISHDHDAQLCFASCILRPLFFEELFATGNCYSGEFSSNVSLEDEE